MVLKSLLAVMLTLSVSAAAMNDNQVNTSSTDGQIDTQTDLVTTSPSSNK